MKYLFIDTETTGLPIDEDFSPMYAENWPRLVSLAYILCDERDVLDKKSFIIKPNGFIIPAESIKVHGITTAEAVAKGKPLEDVLNALRVVIEKCDYIVGHNVSYDINVLNAEFYRYNLTLPVSLKPYYCTMVSSKDYCGLPNNKYPSLEELYVTLTGNTIGHAHDAMADVEAAMECFWILKDSAIIKSQKKKPSIKIYPTDDNISWAAERISMEYANKAYAYLTIACNLIYNKSNFLKSKDDNGSLFDGFSQIDDSILKRIDEKTQKELEYYSKDFRCSKNSHDNSEWVKSMFNFLKEEIYKTSACIIVNKFDNSRSVVLRPYLRYHLKEIEKEYGGKELIEKFKLNSPESTYVTLILDDESSWVDIAIEAVKTKILSSDGMGGEIQPPVNAENYFILMLEFFNNIREMERDKRSDEFNKALEKSLDPKELKKNLDVIKNYSDPYYSPSNEPDGLNPYEKATIIGVLVFLLIFIVFLSYHSSGGKNNFNIEGTDSIEVVDSIADNECHLEFSDYGFALDAPCRMEDVSSEVQGNFLLNYGGVTNGNDLENGAAYQLIVSRVPVGYRNLTKEKYEKVIDKIFQTQLTSFDSHKKIKFGYEAFPGYEVTTTHKGYKEKGVMFVKDNLIIALTVISRNDLDRKLNNFTNGFKVIN